MTIFTATAVFALITAPACGNVDPNSDLAVHLKAAVMTESGGDQYAIGINADPVRGLPRGRVTATTASAAIEKATALLAQGRRIDLGLSQISDRQMPRHRLTLSAAFDECANLRAGAEHLGDDHDWVLAHRRYNCGNINCGEAYAISVTAKVGAFSEDKPSVPPRPPPCAPVWDAWATAACTQTEGAHHEN
jgi:hypothetical protein